MANPNKQWTAEDIEKIWNNTGNTAQKQSAPLPVLTSKSSSYKFKPYENKEYTVADIEKVWKNVERGKQVQAEMKSKATSAPAKNREVPMSPKELKEVRKQQIMKGTDPASMSVKEKERKDYVKGLNNISKQTGTTNAQNYGKRFNYDASYAEKSKNDMAKLEKRAEELTSMNARTIAEDTELDRIRMSADAYNKLHSNAKKRADMAKKANNVKSDILDDATLEKMDARARQLQALDARTPEENAELQNIYDQKDRHDKALERERVANGENHLVNNRRYSQLMSNGRLANDIDKLVDVLYNNADQDITVSSEWASNEGAKAITGGLTKDQFIDQLSKRYELTPAELRDIALTRKTEKNDEEIAKFRSDMNALGAQHPVAGSIGSFAGTIGNAFEAPYNLAVNAITGDDRYTSRMFNTEKEGLREGVKSNINSELGDTLYDIGMGVGDMGVGALMGSAPYVLAGNTANRTMLDALDRGVDPRHAALYSGATGLTDYITNKIGLDYAKELAMEGITASGLKGALARNAVAGLGEGGENLLQDTAQALLDKVINGEDSELSQAYNQLVAQGYSEEDAFREVAKQFAKQEAISFGQGVAMGSAMNAGTSAFNSVRNLPQLERPDLNDLSNIDRVFTDEDVNNRIRLEAQPEEFTNEAVKMAAEDNANNPSEIINEVTRNHRLDYKDNKDISAFKRLFRGRQSKVKNGQMYIPDEDEIEYLISGKRANKNRIDEYNEGKKITINGNEELSNYLFGDNSAYANTVAYGKVSDELADKVYQASNGTINPSDKFLEVEKGHFGHSKRHMEATEEGNLPLSEDEIIYALENVNNSDVINAYRTGKNDQHVELAIKAPDGYYIVVEMVSDSAGSMKHQNSWKITDEKFAEKYNKRSNPNTVWDNPDNDTHDVVAPTTTVNPNGEIVNTDASMPETLQTSVNPDDFVVQKIRVRGEERYQILKDLHDDNPLERASEFGNLVYKTEKGARRAIQKFIENENAKTEQSNEVTSPEETDTTNTDDTQNNTEPVETENPVEVNNGTSNPFENDPKYNAYVARRKAFQESQKGMSMQQMVDSLKELKAMDAEMAEAHPEWFENGKFIGSKNSLKLNIQFFAEKKAQLENQLKNGNLTEAQRLEITEELSQIDELLGEMDEKFNTPNAEEGEAKVSRGVTNSDMRIDAERAAEEIKAGIGKYFVQHENMSYTKGREKVMKDPEAALQKYMNNEGDMYDGSDYDAIRILEQIVKAKRKQAEASGDTELAQMYREQQDRLATTRTLRHTTSGEFNQAASKWISTAEGAVDTATSIMNKALDVMEKGNDVQRSEAQGIRDVGDDIEDYIRNLEETDDLWNELERADRRFRFEHELENAIRDIGRRRGIEIEDNLASKLANDILNGQKDSEALARSIAAFREYNFLGFDEDFLDEVESIFDIADQYDYNSRHRVQLEEMAFRMLANEIYKTGGDFQDKFDAWRYFAMLANTKTHERNIIGNALFADVVNSTSNGIASVLEGITDTGVKGIQKLRKKPVRGIQRTKAFINPASKSDQALIHGGWSDAITGVFRELAGHKFQNDVGNGIENYKPAFNPNTLGGKALNAAVGANEAALSSEDFFFKRQKYAGQLAAYLKANGEDASIFDVEDQIKALEKKKAKSGLSNEDTKNLKTLQERQRVLANARAYAIDKARYATFNQTNEVGSAISKVSKEWRDSNNRVLKFLGREIEGLMAFKNTPANILKTIGDYSPVSIARGLGQTVQAVASKDGYKHSKIGRATVSQALETLSQGLTGTALMALGAKLWKDGILTSSNDEVRKKSDEAEGKQQYALNIDGASYSIDQFAPVATSLFIGAEAYKLWSKYHGEDADNAFFSDDGIFNTDLINDVVNSSLAVADPLIDQTMLQGLQSTIENVRYSQTPGEALMAAFVTPQIGYFGQALPTLGGQIARTADNTRRSLRTNSEGVAGSIERAGRQLMNKLPVLNKQNVAYRDMWGNQQENYDGNILQRAAYQMFSPFYKQDINVEPYMAELDRLYNIDPENFADVLNESFPNKIDGQRLTNEEWGRAQDKAGEAIKQLINASLEKEEYKNLTPEEQYEVQKSLQSLAVKIGTKEVRPDKKINDDLFTAFNGKNYGQVVNMAINDAKGKVLNANVKDKGLPVNEVTKSLVESNDTEGQNKYKDALKVAKQYGYDTISETEYLTYRQKGGVALSEELKYKKAAEDMGVTNTEAFRESLSNGTASQYKDAYNAITTTKTGVDDLGRDTFLSYDDKTAQIYKDKKQQGLNEYAMLKKNLPEGSSKDKDYINALRKTNISESDRAYFFILHKSEIAKSAPSGNENVYMWYQVKDHYNTDGNSSLSKQEKANLYSGVYNYLRSLGYSDSQAKAAQKWTYK